MKLTVELSRFRVKEGKSAVVDQWMAFLNDHMEDTLLTLEGEKMYVETIFREVLDGREYLYWYSVQAEGGIEVDDSESYIDKKHLEYWEECIDPSYGMVDLDLQVIMIPKPVYETMEELDRQYDETFKK
ncbi:DUF6176 family protein [Streptococcus suis]|uniref:Uncharacterized protein n=1 Tax=Streptococcus suis TaxID=1307 RepID=A0A7T1L9G3_STRSU|nr:DUF6176 family protein [Streptococcus suis]MCQ8785337.1 DUF6176 family protein [Streptococcus suis]QPO26266.1 hypothetical protein I5V48_09910 [Streptococcus suis]WNF69150.1 DUF6176 family protein [Streptococcus suis]WQE85124.1 DUF6176 family protein [Streptococcus suis]HEL1588675.1 hypothetical protein [Streptococcus suis]